MSTPYDATDAALVILEHGAPLPTLAAWLGVWADPSDFTITDLVTALEKWNGADYFADLLETLTGEVWARCEEYGCGVWSDDITSVEGDRAVCPDCFDNYFLCSSCREYCNIEGSCTVDGADACEGCAESASWCDECDAYHWDGPCEPEQCGCMAERQRFTLAGWASDELHDVTVPAGVVSVQGLWAIRDLLAPTIGALAARKVVDAVGDQWQGKRGNMTRRISREVWQQCSVKLAPETVSEIGNLAKLHASDATDRTISLTRRDLNDGPEMFAHEESCWWGSYSYSRCALKTWGGIGLRTWADGPDRLPTGRAWILPLGADMRPTRDTETARAFVVFNAYDDLTGYQAARLVADAAGMTYRKISLHVDRMYVNGSVGFLVSDQETADDTDTLTLSHDEHAPYN